MIASLPDEVLLTIFSYLTKVTICKVISKVCRRWYILSFDAQLWKKIVIPRTDLKLTSQSFDDLLQYRDLSLANYVCFLYQGITDDNLKKLIDVNPDIRRLSVSVCTKLTNNGACHISKLSRLRNLDISSCNITNEAIFTIISNAKMIESLCVNSCFQLSNQFIHAICRLQNLSHLEMMNLTRISNDGLEYLSKYKEGLSHLAVSFWSTELTSESLCLLKFSQLYSVEFCSLDNNSDRSLLCFIKNNPSLRHMKLVKCEIFGSFIYQSNLNKLEMIRCENLSKEFYDYFKNIKTNKTLEELEVSVNEQCDFECGFTNVKKLSIRFLQCYNSKFLDNLSKYQFISAANLVSLTLLHTKYAAEQSTFEYVLANCKNLLEFSISRIKFCSNRLHLVENFSIRYISVNIMRNIDELLFEKIAKAIPNLYIADFSENSELTLAMLKSFFKYCNHLQELLLELNNIPGKEFFEFKLDYLEYL